MKQSRVGHIADEETLAETGFYWRECDGVRVLDATNAASEILVCDPDGKVAEFASISPMSQALNMELAFRRIHVAPQWKATVEQAIAGI